MKVKNPSELLSLALNAAWEQDDPQLAWLLSHLAGVSSVVFSDEIDTACIQKTGEKYLIRFSSVFVQKLESAEELLFVLLHEIMHKVQGDLIRDLGLNTPLDHDVANLVEDIVINAQLIRRFFPRPLPLFDRLYDKERFPDALMIPPLNLCDDHRHADMFEQAQSPAWDMSAQAARIDERLMAFFRKEAAEVFKKVENLPEPGRDFYWKNRRSMSDEEALAHWYARAWLDGERTTVAQLYEWIRPLFPAPDGVCKVRLLGDHSEREGGMPGWEDLFNQEGGYYEDEGEDEIDLEAPTRQVNAMVRMIRRVLEPDLKNPLDAQLIQPEKSVIPWVGRRELLWLGMGWWPVFFNNPTITRDLDHLRPHIYLDVSGSTRERQPLIYGIIRHLADIIGEPVYLFSNTVAEASMEDIKKGKVTTTGGTDFDCVIEHASKNRFRKILIITDGFADMSRKNQGRVRSGKPEINLVLTQKLPRRANKIAELAKNVFCLE